MSIIKDLGLFNSPTAPGLNTRTIFDIATGRYQPGAKGEWLLDGGIAPMTGVVGRAGNFKSTTVDSLIALLLPLYPQIECIKYDSENNSFGIERFVQLANGRVELTDRIVIKNKAEMNGDEFCEMVKKICDSREKNRTLVETPFVHNGKPLKIFIPILIDVDSFSLLSFPSLDLTFTEKSIEDSKHNMSDMYEGKLKTKLMNQWSNLSHKYGIYFIFTAHVDDAFQMDPMNPTPKQLQYMKGGDRIKRVGSQFEFLTNVLVQTLSTKVLIDANKECQYPLDSSSDNELSLLTLRVLRCKINGAGTDIPLVTSQKYGILSELTNYHYLRTVKWGTIGSDRSPRSVFHPEIGLSRKDVRELLKANYELSRGIEILAQLKYIDETWTQVPFNLPETAEAFIEQLQKSKTVKTSDILNSRGYWTYDKKDARQYMSVLDIVQSLQK